MPQHQIGEECEPFPHSAVTQQKEHYKDNEVIAGWFNNEFSELVVSFLPGRGVSRSPGKIEYLSREVHNEDRGMQKEAEPDRTLAFPSGKRGKSKSSTPKQSLLVLQYGSPRIVYMLL